VEYDEFIGRVAQRAGASREHAEMLTKATLTVLADRISGGQAMDLADHLPDKLARPLRESPQKPAEGYGFGAFVRRVRKLVPGVPGEAVVPGIRAVLETLRDSVPDKEFQDTMNQLPRDFWELVPAPPPPQAPLKETASSAAGQTADAAGADQGGRTGGQDDAVVQRTAERTGVSTEAAADLTRATLEVLGDRIGGQQAHDLALRLPDTSGQWLDEPPETPAQDYGVEDFVSRIRDIVAEVEDENITPGIRAVMISLRDAVGEAELQIALRPLPGEYDELVVRIG
jgi:uncharacterized protein (DUF2267 family)